MQKVHELRRHSPHVFALLLATAFLGLAYIVVAMLLLIPGAVHATVCGTGSNVPFTDIGGGNCRAYITSSQSVTPPTNWSSTNNTIDCIGGGGGGARGGGGGGGGFARATSAAFSSAITATIGGGGAGNLGSTGGTGGTTSFGSLCAATGGTGGIDMTSSGVGGSGGSGTIGSVLHTGGAGGPTLTPTPDDGGGGGGAAGPSGNGVAGSGRTGGAGDAGAGGAGGAGAPSVGGQPGSPGGNGNEYGSGYGAGGGGGSGTGCWSACGGAGGTGVAGNGAAGGYYGGGGGGGGQGYFVDGTGATGRPGLIVITYTPPPGSPGTPTFSSVSGTGITVNWSAASGATTYKVERCSGAGCSTFTQIASGVAATSYADSGLTVGTSYTYRVRGTNTGGDGAYSATATQVTLPGTPGTPTFSGITGNSMTVSWSAASGAASYKIERCTGGPGCSIFVQIASGVTGTSYLDSGLSASTIYTYHVRATNSAGDGNFSTPASQTTTSGVTGSGIGSGIPITGWLWSDNFGWISTNCSNTNSCGTVNYGMAIDPNSGELSGDGWSDNIGWVSANAVDLAGCPTAPCTATISGGNLVGWMKVLSGGTSQSGGWDGFISLNGAGYGVAFSGGSFSGYAWDASGATMNNVKEMDGTTANGVQVAGEGWISFAGASSTYGTCSAGTVYSCTNPDSSGIYRTIVQTVTNGSCAQTVTNTSCTAPQFCAPGVSTCVTPPPTDSPTGSLTGHLAAKPNLVPYNATTTIYWGLVNVNSCTVTANDGTSWTGAFSATSSCPTKYNGGCQTLPITQQTTFTLTCTDFNSQPYKETATVNVLPQFQEQ